MDFPITIDRDACANLPGIESGTYLVSVDDSAISVYFGDRFEADIALSAVASAQPMDDPRPQAFLPMGVSSAVSTLGPETVTVLGAHTGLVEMTFREPVEARVPPPDARPNSEPDATDGTIRIRRLIFNLDDPEEFLSALNRQREGGSPGSDQPLEADAVDTELEQSSARPWPTGG